MPKLTIDGIEVEVEDGLNIIQAASRVGIEVPHFCYHPALSIVAQCRQCLIEVEGVPKIMPACNTFVREGLNVITDSEKAVAARKATLEFTLINHPLDCPICDKGGECPLQLTTFKHGPGHSRFEGPEQKKVRKKYFLGENVVYDPNRCIMCTRCVRFTDEITKTGELGYHNRGFRKKIVSFPFKSLNNELAGNVIDLCPVGALLSKDTLHEERVWYWKFTDTVCSLCSTGCNITVGVDPRKGKVSRVRPKPNPEVNEYWVCDRGRYGFRDVQEIERMKEPLMRFGESFERSDWEDALKHAHHKISEASQHQNGALALIGSANLTNEELFLLRTFTVLMPGSKLVAASGKNDGKKAFGLISSDPYPNTAGVEKLGIDAGDEAMRSIINSIMDGAFSAAYIIGVDLFDYVDDFAVQALRKSLLSLTALCVQDTKITRTGQVASILLPGATPYEKEGTYVNDAGRIQKLNAAMQPPGNAKPDWEILISLGTQFGKGGFGYSNPQRVMNAISSNVEGFEGIDYERIGPLGLRLGGS